MLAEAVVAVARPVSFGVQDSLLATATASLCFPSDWVVYHCASSACLIQHLSRVIEVGFDQRERIPASYLVFDYATTVSYISRCPRYICLRRS